MITSKTSLLPVALMALLSLPVTAQSLPGGASAVNEVHGDWVVACATQAETVRCALSHNQLSNDANRSRILAIELTAVDPDGVTKGAMALAALALLGGLYLVLRKKKKKPVKRK